MSFAFSFSVLDMHDLCPKKYYHIKVAKDAADTDSSFAGDGKKIHKAVEKRVVPPATPLPLTYRYMEPLIKRFAELPGENYGEQQLALNRNFEPCAWFDKDTYVRAIIDFLNIQGNTATLIDWKTGKVRPKMEQLKLMGAVLSQTMPEITNFRSAFVWVNQKDITPLVFSKSHIADFWADILPRADEIEEALKTTDFPATPNPLCKWCPVTQCPHHP